jgi:cephalosporin hydroxylase
MSSADPQDRAAIARMAADPETRAAAARLFERTIAHRYSYNFTWLGRPVIQYPQDLVALQEIIWRVKPDLIVETGIAHGGSLIFSASMLELLGGNGRVLGIDIDIRAHNRAEIERHPLARRITMIQGSSVDEAVAREVGALSVGRRVMVCLDANHAHAHVLKELQLYSPLVPRGSYLVVLDTVVEDLAPGQLGDRPWGPGNSPKTAVHEFLRTNSRFRIDKAIESKLLLTVAPDGYLECVSD